MRTQKETLGGDGTRHSPCAHLLEVFADDLWILDLSGDVGDHQCPRDLGSGEKRLCFHKNARYTGPSDPEQQESEPSAPTRLPVS